MSEANHAALEEKMLNIQALAIVLIAPCVCKFAQQGLIFVMVYKLNASNVLLVLMLVMKLWTKWVIRAV